MKWIVVAIVALISSTASAKQIDSALVGTAIAELEVKTKCSSVIDAVGSIESTQTDEQLALTLAFISFTSALKSVDGPTVRELLVYCQTNPDDRFIDFPRD